MAIEIKARVIEIGDTQQFNSFKIRKVVIETIGDRYPQFHEVEFTGDNADKVETLGIGEEVNLKCGLNGRRWESKNTGKVMYFTTLRVFEFVVNGKSAPQPQRVNAPENQAILTPEDEENLPF